MFKKKKTNKNTSVDVDQIEVNAQEVQGAQPRKKVKLQLPKSSLASSTNDQKITTEEQVHEKFTSLNYKAKQEEQKEEVLVGDEAVDETETELAKKKYLENIDITKKIREGKLDKKIYRGMNGYANYQLNANQLENPQDDMYKKFGPTRNKGTAAQNTCRFDYDKSLCKDWHDSGYCVFGNSCIYIHDRSNYKTGWELEKEFEKTERQRWKRINNPNYDEYEEQLKDIEQFKPPQVCPKCKNVYKNPVEVECSHIFCLKCALDLNKTTKKCIECNCKLGGIMNNAQKTIKNKKDRYDELKKAIDKNRQSAPLVKVKHANNDSIDVFKD